MTATIIKLQMNPLFIPLKSEFYDSFCNGSKDTEFRMYGPRWNEKTCPIGRPVTISKGYGIRNRRSGIVVGFEVSLEPTKTEAWQKCYGGKDSSGAAACIRIKLDEALP